MESIRKLKRLLTATAVVALVLGAMGIANAALNGAIFTTISDGTAVNANIYNFRTDVYLNGGPQNQSPKGLPDGYYFFQVTDPNGNVLLSTDDAVCRQLQVINGVVAGAAADQSGPFPSNCLHSNGTYNSANGSTPVQLAPFDFTPNAGGEYKVWLIAQTSNTLIDADDKTLSFSNPDSKTDNFKVLESSTCPNPPGCQPLLPSISGVKFYDTNANGAQDSGEPGIVGWQIVLFGTVSSNTTTVLTDTTGSYQFLNLTAGPYGVCEILPTNSTPIWVPTTPTSLSTSAPSTGNNFGNVCLGGGGGLTLGFWSNPNGQTILAANDSAWRTLLNALNLRNATGANYDVPTSGVFGTKTTGAYGNFRTWLLGATATNMAYMLSAQLTAMELNVFSGKVVGTDKIYACYGGNALPSGCSVPGLSSTCFISISDLMNNANSNLLTNSNTTASGAARSCQQFMKNALDDANNNRNFVQTPDACEVSYSGLEKSCAP